MTVGDHHVLNLQLHNLAIVFAVVEVAGRDNLRLLNKNIIEALLSEGAAAKGNGGISELDQAVAHSARVFELINVDETIFEVSLGLLEQDGPRGAEGTLLGQCVATTREDDGVRVVHSERLTEKSSVSGLKPAEVLLLMP